LAYFPYILYLFSIAFIQVPARTDNKVMDLIWSLALIVVLLLALNHMAGGRASNVLRPVTGIASRLISMVVRALTALFSSVLRIGAGSVKLPKVKGDTKETGRGPGPPPPRWEE
jgi:hypothetical protein